jgi:predicted phosphoribosyltransferase
MTIVMEKVGEHLTIIQQPQDFKGYTMGYLRRLNLSDDDVKELIKWLHKEKGEMFYDNICKWCEQENLGG